MLILTTSFGIAENSLIKISLAIQRIYELLQEIAKIYIMIKAVYIRYEMFMQGKYQ